MNQEPFDPKQILLLVCIRPLTMEALDKSRLNWVKLGVDIFEVGSSVRVHCKEGQSILSLLDAGMDVGMVLNSYWQ